MTNILSALISPRWRWVTLAVILGMVFLALLGRWQLHRLEWRRGLNAETQAMLDAGPLDLSKEIPNNIETMVNRQVVARGTYDIDSQLRVLSQTYNGQPGIYLLTPLILEDGKTAILVNRGWIPLREAENIHTFDEPGRAKVSGYIQASQTLSRGRRTEVGADGSVYRIDVAAIAAATGRKLLPVYIQAVDPDGRDTLPIQITPDLTLDEGNHLSYAIQWFLFSAMLGAIYLYYVRKSLRQTQVNGR